MDAALNQYLAAGLIQHLTSPYSSPLVVIPKKSGDVRITLNYKKLNQISKLSQLPIPRVDQALDSLDSLGSGRVFSPVRLGFLVPPDNHTKGHSSPYSVLHTHGPL